MNTPTTAVTRSVLLAGRDFTGIFVGRIEISATPDSRERLQINVGDISRFHSLFVSQQIIDVNQGDSPAPLELPFLDALPRRDFFARGK
jgi:hypothetical protein